MSCKTWGGSFETAGAGWGRWAAGFPGPSFQWQEGRAGLQELVVAWVSADASQALRKGAWMDGQAAKMGMEKGAHRACLELPTQRSRFESHLIPGCRHPAPLDGPLLKLGCILP